MRTASETTHSPELWRANDGAAQKPLAVDLCCGLGGWTEGLLAEGYYVVGFDIEAHEYGEERYPGHLVLEDVLKLNGAQFRHASLIVASPPCQEYSYMAMPWSRAKQIARGLRGLDVFPEPYSGSRTIADLNALFDACFRIQREASEAAGHRIPLVVENVRGAEPWVGRAKWNFGSYYLWGDVPALMPQTLRAQKFNPDGTSHGQGSWFAIADSKERGAKNTGGSWFAIGSPGQKVTGNNPDGRKNAGFRFDGSGRSFQSESVARHAAEGVKLKDVDGYERTHPNAFGWKIPATSSHSSARKAASARIAKIPFALSSWIARTYRPATQQRASA